MIKNETTMTLKDALRILGVVKCDNLGYVRDLSYTPTPQEIGLAIEVIEDICYPMLDNEQC